MTPKQKLNIDLYAVIIQAYKREKNIAEVARQYGKSRQRIHQILKEQGITTSRYASKVIHTR